MHKFFCNYNLLTEKYELSLSRSNLFNNKIKVQAENSLLTEIQKDIQSLYENIVIIKDKIKDEANLLLRDKQETIISNLSYSLFASPLELPDNEQNVNEIKNLVQKSITLINKIESEINIPEYNRLANLIKNNLQCIFNSLTSSNI